RAVLRRGETRPGGTDLIRSGQLEIDLPGMRVRRGAELIQLTPTEFHLLATLASEPGRVFTRTQLLNAIRGVMSESYERAIDAHVKNIRRKLESPVDATQYIQTVHGVGYRFSDA
ncbi:MAG TPA: response regulator transcription factor, partial [Thermomicrobiales bacterium]|nr:response regulator transcription factor [Thermomicrobiales bacterium]